MSEAQGWRVLMIFILHSIAAWQANPIQQNPRKYGLEEIIFS